MLLSVHSFAYFHSAHMWSTRTRCRFTFFFFVLSRLKCTAGNEKITIKFVCFLRCLCNAITNQTLGNEFGTVVAFRSWKPAIKVIWKTWRWMMNIFLRRKVHANWFWQMSNGCCMSRCAVSSSRTLQWSNSDAIRNRCGHRWVIVVGAVSMSFTAFVPSVQRHISDRATTTSPLILANNFSRSLFVYLNVARYMARATNFSIHYLSSGNTLPHKKISWHPNYYVFIHKTWKKKNENENNRNEPPHFRTIRNATHISHYSLRAICSCGVLNYICFNWHVVWCWRHLLYTKKAFIPQGKK